MTDIAPEQPTITPDQDALLREQLLRQFSEGSLADIKTAFHAIMKSEILKSFSLHNSLSEDEVFALLLTLTIAKGAGVVFKTLSRIFHDLAETPSINHVDQVTYSYLASTMANLHYLTSGEKAPES